MNTAIILFMFFTIVIITYISVLYAICRYQKCDIATAKRLFWNYVFNCFGFKTEKQPAIVNYPVYIGIDDLGFPHSDIIEDVFSELATDFETFYYYDLATNGNCLLYKFKAELPKKVMPVLSMIQYTQKKCDMIVHRFMHRMDPQISHINYLVATAYADNILTVSIARNIYGVKENHDKSEKLRKYYKSINNVTKKRLEERWDNDDDEMGL